MKQYLALQTHFKEIPYFIRRFMIKALALFILWKLVYHLVLFPTRFPDFQLTQLTAITTGFVYQNLFGAEVTYTNQETSQYPKIIMYINGERGIGIADGCNGLELYVLYAGFILCLPTSIRRQLGFIAVGIAGIYVLNTLRVLALAWMHQQGYPTDFAHHYLFKVIIYGIIFFAWVKYCRKFYFDA